MEIFNENVKIHETIGMESPCRYRNKAQFPLGLDKDNKPIMGVFATRTHDIIPMRDCKIQNYKSEQTQILQEMLKKQKKKKYLQRKSKIFLSCREMV